jgi:hypothetical protein
MARLWGQEIRDRLIRKHRAWTQTFHWYSNSYGRYRCFRACNMRPKELY